MVVILSLQGRRTVQNFGGADLLGSRNIGGAAGGAVLVGSQNIGGAAAPPAPPVPPALGRYQSKIVSNS